MWEASHFFSKNISIYAIFNDQSFNNTLTNNIVSFEQLGAEFYFSCALCPQYHFFTISKPYPLSGSFRCMRIWLVIRRFGVRSLLGLATFCSGNWWWHIFYKSFSPFCWFKKGIYQFLAKECAQVLVDCLEDYACPGKVCFGKLTDSTWP